jgi:hypothetical protein
MRKFCSVSDFQSSSPPKKDATTIYTPSSGQKRFNPFMKDNGGTSGSTAMGKNDEDESIYSRTNTSPTHKLTPLTPTKSHPLMDLEHTTKQSRGEFMDTTSSSSSEESDDNNNNNNKETTEDSGEMKDDAVVDCGEDEHENKTQDDALNLPNNNFVENSPISLHTQLPAEADSMTIQQHALDEKNNNTQLNESDDEAEKQQQRLTVDKVMRRKKSPSRVNNNNNIRNNNNRMSYPVTRDRSQPADIMTTSATVMTASMDRIDGKATAAKKISN